MEQYGTLRLYRNKTEGYWYVLTDKGKGDCIGMWGIKEDAIKFCKELKKKENGKKEKDNGESLS